MKRRVVQLSTGILAGPVLLSLFGCAAGQNTKTHEMTAAHAQASGGVTACQKCYDVAIVDQPQYGKGPSWPGTHIIHKRVCEPCNAGATVNTENGKPTIKCSMCAVRGLPNDLSRPPNSGA